MRVSQRIVAVCRHFASLSRDVSPILRRHRPRRTPHAKFGVWLSEGANARRCFLSDPRRGTRVNIRTYQAGDERFQVEIFNETAAGLPRFKPATVEEIGRRCQAPEFDPTTRLFAESDGRPVGYVAFHA